MTAKHYLLIALLIALAFVVGYCNRQKDLPSVVPMPAETERKGKVNTDSIKSRIEAEYRARETKLTQAHQSALAEVRASIAKKKDKATTSVKSYQNAPTIAKCDTAIADLTAQVSDLETGLAISDSIAQGQQRVISSFASTVQRKDSAIAALNTGWQQANAENAELTRKVKNRNKVIKIGAGILAILAGVIAVR